MPGLSLWLIPHRENPFTKTCQELISDTVPRNFVSEADINHFPPHVTVASDIKEDVPKNPQEWLDGLKFPNFQAEKNEVLLELDTVEAEDPFFRKMNIAIKPNANLNTFVATCRAQAGVSSSEAEAEAWVEKEFRPHLSLFYGDVPTSEVKNKVPLIEMKIGFALGDLFACCGGALGLGGKLVLVDTTKPIKEWKDSIIAERETSWAMWRATRNLI